MNDEFIYREPTKVLITIEYFDAGAGEMGIEYDSSDFTSRDEGRWKDAFGAELRNANIWKTTSFELDDAYFGNRQHDDLSDFRIWGPEESQGLCVARVTVSK